MTDLAPQQRNVAPVAYDASTLAVLHGPVQFAGPAFDLVGGGASLPDCRFDLGCGLVRGGDLGHDRVGVRRQPIGDRRDQFGIGMVRHDRECATAHNPAASLSGWT